MLRANYQENLLSLKGTLSPFLDVRLHTEPPPEATAIAAHEEKAGEPKTEILPPEAAAMATYDHSMAAAKAKSTKPITAMVPEKVPVAALHKKTYAKITATPEEGKPKEEYYENKHIGLSPVAGACAWHSGWIKGIYKYGSINDHTVKLVRMLFNNVYADIFPTRSTGEPIYLITMAGLFPTLVRAIIENNLSSDAQVGFFVQKVKEEYTKTPEKKTKEIKKIERKTRELVTTIAKAQIECNPISGKFPVWTVEQILTAYWYSLQPQIDTPFAASLTDYMNAIIEGFDPSAYALLELAETPFNVESLVEYPERLLLSCNIKELSLKYLPPHVEQYKFEYKGKKAKINCVEATMQNLLNFMYYDHTTGQYNLSLLPSPPHPSVSEFYEKYPMAAQSTEKEVQQEWFNMLSNIPGITYRYKNYGIVSEFENVMNLLSYLLSTRINNVEGLIPLITNSQRSATIVRSRAFGDIPPFYYITIQNKIDDSQAKMELAIMSAHSDSEFLKIDQLVPPILFYSLRSSLKQTFQFQQFILFFIHNNPDNIVKKLNLDEIYNFIQYLMFSSNLDNEDVRVEWIEILLTLLEKKLIQLEKIENSLSSLLEKVDEETPLVTINSFSRMLSLESPLTEHIARFFVEKYFLLLQALQKSNPTKENIQFLIRNGLDLNIKDKDLRTPIFCAATMPSKATIEKFLENGANAKHKDTSENIPLHFAAYANSDKTIRALISHTPETIDWQNKDGNTPLHIAVGGLKVSAAKELVANGARTDIPNNKGLTPRAFSQKMHYLMQTSGESSMHQKELAEKVMATVEGRLYDVDEHLSVEELD